VPLKSISPATAPSSAGIGATPVSISATTARSPRVVAQASVAEVDATPVSTRRPESSAFGGSERHPSGAPRSTAPAGGRAEVTTRLSTRGRRPTTRTPAANVAPSGTRYLPAVPAMTGAHASTSSADSSAATAAAVREGAGLVGAVPMERLLMA
jgi:hypothetical protein